MNSKLLTLAAFGGLCLHAQQQKSMGTIASADAQLSGGLEVAAARTRLLSNASVTAFNHTARIDLDRGGEVQVCATSAFHLLRSGSGDALLFALDRGAIEIRTPSRPQDAILTPDLRFTLLTGGPLDLRIGVTRAGDTCVENHGDTAPVLQITETFGSATYHLAPTQHVRFLHGSVRDVIDRERTDCGCPSPAPAPPPPRTLAATRPAPPPPEVAQKPVAAHELPLAARLPPDEPRPSAAAAPPHPAAPATPPKPASPPPRPHRHGIFHAIGHFFHWLFADGPKPLA